MDDEITHAGIVDSRMGFRPPGRMRRSVIGVDADDIERVEVVEFGRAKRFQLAAEDKVEELLLFSRAGHSSVLVAFPEDRCLETV